MKEDIEQFKKAYKINSKAEAIKTLRTCLIKELIESGLSYEVVGKVFKITKQRVEQIKNKK
jgi:hypothetical protein